MKVLVIEDNKRVAQFVLKGLRESGHTVDHSDNGRDGMFMASSERYDAIVLDRMLPGVRSPALRKALTMVRPSTSASAASRPAATTT